MKPIVVGSLVVLTAASLTANGLLYMRYSTNRPLVTVGGKAISKKDYQDALDYQTKGMVLKSMVIQAVINQAAANAGVTPTAAEVDADLASIKRTNPQSLGDVDQDPSKLAQVKDSLKTALALENLRIQGVTVTNAEVADFYNLHKRDLTLPAQVQTSMVVAENSVDAAQAASLLQQNIAPDVIARQPRLHVVGQNGFNVNVQSLPPVIGQKLNNIVYHMKVGAVQTVPVGKSYLIVRANKSLSSGTPPLAQIKAQVVRLAKLEKATSAAVEVATLYQAAKPQFHVAKYEDYFSDLNQMDVSVTGKKTASAQ